MNKKGQERDWRGLAFFAIICFLLAAVLIYFLGNLAIWLGVFALIAALGFGLLGIYSKEDTLIGIAIVLFFSGLVLIIGGLAITSFFENNEIGRVWLGGGKTVINTTAQTYSGLRRA